MTFSRIAVLPRTIWQTLATHPSHAVAAFAVLIVAVRMTLLAVDLNDRYHAGILAAEHSARSYAEVLSEHTARTFEAVDRILAEVELIHRDDDAGRYATAEAVHEALRHLQQTSPVLIAIGWTNAVGDLEAHSSQGAIPASGVGDLPLFIAQRDRTADGLFAASPFRSASSNGLITAASRRLNRADGSFAGIAIAILDPSYFRGIYRSIEFAVSSPKCNSAA